MGVAEYIEKGFTPEAAAYFAGGRKRIVGVEPNEGFTLTLRFDNGEARRYDVRPLLAPGTVFAPLLDADTFRRVYVDENGAIAWDIDPAIDSREVWSNKIDLCPDACYLDSTPIGP